MRHTGRYPRSARQSARMGHGPDRPCSSAATTSTASSTAQVSLRDRRAQRKYATTPPGSDAARSQRDLSQTRAQWTRSPSHRAEVPVVAVEPASDPPACGLSRRFGRASQARSAAYQSEEDRCPADMVFVEGTVVRFRTEVLRWLPGCLSARRSRAQSSSSPRAARATGSPCATALIATNSPTRLLPSLTHVTTRGSQSLQRDEQAPLL